MGNLLLYNKHHTEWSETARAGSQRNAEGLSLWWVCSVRLSRHSCNDESKSELCGCLFPRVRSARLRLCKALNLCVFVLFPILWTLCLFSNASQQPDNQELALILTKTVFARYTNIPQESRNLSSKVGTPSWDDPLIAVSFSCALTLSEWDDLHFKVSLFRINQGVATVRRTRFFTVESLLTLHFWSKSAFYKEHMAVSLVAVGEPVTQGKALDCCTKQKSFWGLYSEWSVRRRRWRLKDSIQSTVIPNMWQFAGMEFADGGFERIFGRDTYSETRLPLFFSILSLIFTQILKKIVLSVFLADYNHYRSAVGKLK